MATYRYLACDMLTDAPLAWLELDNVKFDRRIIQPGGFAASMPIPNRTAARRAQRVIPTQTETHTGPGRTVIHVYRDIELWGTYILWAATPKEEDGAISVELRGASLESYLYRTEIRQDWTFTGADQSDGITRAFLEDLQADPHADLGMILTLPDMGRPRDRTYRRSEAATIGQRLEELAGVEHGFEWMIRTYLVDGARTREFVAAERLSTGQTDHVWKQPGAVLAWSYAIDATEAGTSYQARGDTINTDLGEDSEPLMGGWYHVASHVDFGWPRLDITLDYRSVTSGDTLNDYSIWWVNNRPGATRIPQVKVRLGDRNRFTPNSLGDYARIQLVNDWWPLDDNGAPTFSNRWRIVGCEIAAPDKDTEEECTLIFEEAV